MRTTKRTLTLASALAVLVSSTALAQGRGPGYGSGGWGPGATYTRLYDAAKLDTINGTVLTIQRVTPLRGMHQGVELLVVSGKDTANVHLGPDWYLDHQDVTLSPEDQVQVIGSVATLEGKPVILAAEVTRGKDRLRLRDLKTGTPVWSGSYGPCPRR